MSNLDKIRQELADEAKKIDIENQVDPVRNAIASLIMLQKNFLYGIDKGNKKNKMEEIINKKLTEYQENNNAS